MLPIDCSHASSNVNSNLQQSGNITMTFTLKPLFATLAFAASTLLLTSCDALQTLAPAVQNARNFVFHYKELPSTMTMNQAITAMTVHATSVTSNTTEYRGNKENNTQFFRLRISQPGSATSQGLLEIKVQDATTQTLDPNFSPGVTGLNIDVIPLPQIGTEVEFGNLLMSFVQQNEMTEFENNNDPNSYFRLTLTAMDLTNNTASGVFEAIVRDPVSGRMFAITDGEFHMTISQ